MLFRANILLLMILVCLPAIALAQKKQPASPQPAAEPPPDFRSPNDALFPLNVDNRNGVDAEKVEAMLNALLKHAQPDAIAAEVLQCRVNKIVLVPHIFWREPKWGDWAEKANRASGAKPTTGPDDKIYLNAQMDEHNVRIELGPFNAATGEEFQKIGQRISVKMVRDSAEFIREFIRQQQSLEFDQLAARIRDLDDEAEPLRKQLQVGVGLLSQAQLSERVADLQRQLITADLSVQVMKAREKAIREQLAEVKAETKTSSNEAIGTLKRIVELRKARFERLKTAKSTAAVSQEDVDKAEEEMLAAQVDLDRATAVLQKADSQSQLDPLTAELRKIVVDRAEGEARIDYLQKVLHDSADELLNRRDTDARNDRLQAQLKGIEKHRSELQNQLNQTKDALNSPTQSLQISLRE
jgi:hypothetical protein